MIYKDIISYELAGSVQEQDLIRIAKDIVNNWMKLQEGFIKWEIHKNNDGSYSDIVYWASKEAAKKAEQQMAHIPNAAEWYGCYKEGTISSKNLTLIFES